MKQKISINLEDYEARYLEEIEKYIKENTDLYLPTRSATIGHIIKIIKNNKNLLDYKIKTN